MMNIQVVKPTSAKMGIMLDLTLDGNPVQMELDTGASLSIISEKMWRSTLQAPVLAQSRVQLRTYTGQHLKILGEKVVKVQYGDQTWTLPLIVVSGDGPALFGRNWLREIRLDWGSIQKLSAPLEDMLKFSDQNLVSYRAWRPNWR